MASVCATCGMVANEVFDSVVDGTVYHNNCIPTDTKDKTMARTVTVYVDKEDHFVILSEEEAHDSYDQMLDDVYGPLSVAGIEYDVSRVLQQIDPTAYHSGFVDYADGVWEEMEMPYDLYMSDDDDAKEEWVGNNV